MVDMNYLVPRGQFVLVAFCVIQTLLNIHLYRGKLATDRDNEFIEYQKAQAFKKCRQSLKKCQKASPPKCKTVAVDIDSRQAEYNEEPIALSVVKPPNVFSLSEFDFETMGTPFPTIPECTCDKGMADLDAATGMKLKHVEYVTKFKERTVAQSRKRRHEDYMKRREWSRPVTIYTNPSVPLKYPASGLHCQPHGHVEMPMLVTQFFGTMKIVIVAKFGEIAVGVDGTPQQRMELEGDSTYINKLLKSIVYKNKMYDSIMYFDMVTVWIQGFEAVQFQVTIDKEKLEVLQAADVSNEAGKVNELVTVIIKTFIRYPCLIRLVQSIRQFYPFVTIIIADDSPDDAVPSDNEEFNAIRGDKHVRYFKLPEKTGWNAGRAVLLSQVTTEFFITCDDDFIFNKETQIERFLDIIGKTGFDIVGGGVGQSTLNSWRKIARYDIQRGSSGHCVSRRNGFYGTLTKYPDCHVGDVIANFFIARTLTAGSIRFDPLFTQMAHREYFLDGTGQLRIAVCPSIWAGHDAQGCEGRDAEYMASRRPQGKEWTKMINDIDILWYQRNYLKCVVDL